MLVLPHRRSPKCGSSGEQGEDECHLRSSRVESLRLKSEKQGTLGSHSERKNDTSKSIGHTISHNVPKLVTTSTTKVKNPTHAASSKISSANQTLLSSPKPVVNGLQKPVPSLQDTLTEKKNSTTKTKVNTINLNVQKPVTTFSNTKMKNQTRSTSSKTSSISQTLPSTTKPAVDGVQKPEPALPGKLNEKKDTSGLNVPKLVTTVLKTKRKNQTHPTPSHTPPSNKISVDESLLSEKKNSTLKSTDQTINVNVSKTVTILLNTKTKNQTQSTPSKISNVSQPQDILQKHIPSLQDPLSENKNFTVKSITQTKKPKVVTILSNTKISSTSSEVNQTIPSFKKPDVDTIQKPVQSVESTVNNTKLNAQKPETTFLKTKKKDQTQLTSTSTSRVDQTLSSSSKHDVDAIQKPVQSVQSTVNTTKLNAQKPGTALLKTKKKDTTQSTSSPTSRVHPTHSSSSKHNVDAVQKPVQSEDSTVNTTKLNAQKPGTTLLKTKIKDQTQSASSATSRVNQTLSSSSKHDVDTVQKPVQHTIGEKKNVTTKSTVNTINHKAQKQVTTVLKTKVKNTIHSTSAKNSSIDQTLTSSSKSAVDVAEKPATFGEKKNTTTKSVTHTSNVNALKPVSTKITNQTISTSSKLSSINKTISSTPMSAVDVQKSGPSLQGTLNKKKNSTSKSTDQTISRNVPKLTSFLQNQTHTSSKLNSVNQTKSISQTIKVNSSKPITTSLDTKTKNQTQTSSSKIRNVSQTVTFTATPVVDGVQKPTKDKPAESSPVKVVITESCVQQGSQTDTGNITKVRETELILNLGSPLVMTHRINLVQGACMGSCETQMTALRDRVEFLEKEMSAIKKTCVKCSGEQCPKNCSGQGKCEGGKCVCFQGFSGPDCSGKTCPSNCNKNGKCVKGKCMCQTGYTGPDCSKAVDKNITVTVETVTMKMPTAKPDGTSVKTKPDKTIFVKNPKKDTPANPTVSPDKVQSNTTKIDKHIIKTVGQVLLKHKGKKLHEQTKGKTPVIHLDSVKQSQMDKKNNPKDEPVYQNVTQTSVKKGNETSKYLENLIKGTKGSSNVTTPRTKVTTRTAGDQPESKANVTLTEKDKKLFHGNVTTMLQAERNSNKHVNGLSIDSKIHIKHFNKTSSRLSVIGSVEVHNITSTGFILSWETPRDMFKNFTVTRREIRAENEDSAKIQDGAAAENVTDVQRASSNRTSAKDHSNKLEGRTVKKFSQVLAGTARSYLFKGLQPQTRYSVSLFGSGPGVRSKIHRLTLSTGPEPPTDLMFSNITETSVSVSWGKPKSIVAEFKVTYTNIVTGESVSMSVDSQLSHVLLSKLSAGSTYDITLSSVLETLESEPITASVTTVPDSPTELKVVNITDTKALLVWKPSQAKVDSYILSYGTTKSPNVTITVTLSGSTVEHQLRGLHRSSLYMVKITSQVNRLQSSPVSTTFTTGSGVKLQVVTPDEVTFHSAVISWRAPRVAFKSYRLTYKLNEEVKELILNPSVTRYELTGLAAFSNYTVKIEGERDGQYISFVSAEFPTAMLPHPYPTECSEVQINGMKESGEAEIYPEGKDGEPVWVYCDMETDGGGWTVFQRRIDGSTDFFRSWRDYSKGFGLLSGEFWLGNDILYTLTSLSPMSLRIDLRSGNDTAFAHYANFSVNSETNHYAIELSGYSGTAGDSMKYHNGRPFSTKDKDPDTLSIHCAKAYMGGWWYKNCYKANLNGIYASYSDNKGVVWIDWKGKDASLPFTEMKLRPSHFSQTIPTTPTTQG
ncbi:tenascin-R [Pseudorasbora parva]|uniref:tenascin-R n=1 Tax=Pseudorasbora parva TaxID=51549 RepID=UPI00351F4903